MDVQFPPASQRLDELFQETWIKWKNLIHYLKQDMKWSILWHVHPNEHKIEIRLVSNYFSVGRIIISDCIRIRYANRIKISFVENLWALETKWQRLFAEIVIVIGLLFPRQQNQWKDTKQGEERNLPLKL